MSARKRAKAAPEITEADCVLWVRSVVRHALVERFRSMMDAAKASRDLSKMDGIIAAMYALAVPGHEEEVTYRLVAELTHFAPKVGGVPDEAGIMRRCGSGFVFWEEDRTRAAEQAVAS